MIDRLLKLERLVKWLYCKVKNGGTGGGIQSVQEGDNITVDNTDPLNPIINATGGGTTGDSYITTLSYTLDDLGVTTMGEVTDELVATYINSLGLVKGANEIYEVEVTDSNSTWVRDDFPNSALLASLTPDFTTSIDMLPGNTYLVLMSGSTMGILLNISILVPAGTDFSDTLIYAMGVLTNDNIGSLDEEFLGACQELGVETYAMHGGLYYRSLICPAINIFSKATFKKYLIKDLPKGIVAINEEQLLETTGDYIPLGGTEVGRDAGRIKMRDTLNLSGYGKKDLIPKEYSDRAHSYSFGEELTGGLWMGSKPIYKIHTGSTFYLNGIHTLEFTTSLNIGTLLNIKGSISTLDGSIIMELNSIQPTSITGGLVTQEGTYTFYNATDNSITTAYYKSSVDENNDLVVSYLPCIITVTLEYTKAT